MRLSVIFLTFIASGCGAVIDARSLEDANQAPIDDNGQIPTVDPVVGAEDETLFPKTNEDELANTEVLDGIMKGNDEGEATTLDEESETPDETGDVTTTPPETGTNAPDAEIEAPVAAPAEGSVSSPDAAPIAAPTAASIASPITAPVAAPIASPIDAPITAPVAAPAASPVASPIDAPVTSPVASPIDAPIATPIASPIASPIGTPVAAPVAAPFSRPTTNSFPVSAPFPQPTRPPTKPYVSRDDDPVAKDNENFLGEWFTNDSTIEEMEHDQNVIIALSVVFVVMFFFAVFVAYQMLENPDGCCASICRITVACWCGILRCVCYPCRALCGCTGQSPQSYEMPEEGTFANDLELS